MQAKAADQFNPDWQVWLNRQRCRSNRAMSADARRTTHPIQQPVANESEAMAVFDGITYSKGQAFIRMLENYLGDETFRDGIRRYMAVARLQQRDHGRSVGGARGRIRQAGGGDRRGFHRAGRGAARRRGDVTCGDGQRTSRCGRSASPSTIRTRRRERLEGTGRLSARCAPRGRRRDGRCSATRSAEVEAGRLRRAAQAQSRRTSAITACNTMRRRAER